MKITINECRRCGTCCLKGGPVLHTEDIKIIREGYAGHRHLVTLRKGEIAFNPAGNRPVRIPKELIKVNGKDREWTCLFYDEEKTSCAIYEHRFIECRLLKCWDTSELMSVIGSNTLARSDLINPRDPILEVIEAHEKECPCSKVEDLIVKASRDNDKTEFLSALAELVRKDFAMRSYALNDLGLRREYEPFIFGRPLKEIIELRGLSVRI
jgi:Fe-S-cluster containining protein